MNQAAVATLPHARALQASHGITARFLASAPLVNLLHDWEQRIAFAEQNFGESELASMGALRRSRDGLARALAEAARTDLWVSVEEASEATSIPRSTLTHMCRTRGKEIGAQKVSKQWSIHLPTLCAHVNRNGVN